MTVTARRLHLALVGALHGACSDDFVAGDAAAHARATLARMVQHQELPGAQYVAVSADRLLLDEQEGVADVATGERMQGSTLQMAYSITKVVTAIAAMQLVDAGKLDLDAPLSRYWPAHPYGTSVRIRSLLAHTAGIPNPMPLDWFALEGEPFERDAALQRVLSSHPKRSGAPDGAKYRYTNIGYWLLEKAIESAAGQDYARLVEQKVFAPVSVTGHQPTFSLDQERSFATGHSRRFAPMNLLLHALTPASYWASPNGRWSRTARVQSLGRGYGGLFCSASMLGPVLQDLLRASPRLLSARARDQMFTEKLGWVIGDLNGVRYFGKQGGGLGFHGNVRVYPALGVATALLSNRTEISAGAIDARSDKVDAGFVAAP